MLLHKTEVPDVPLAMQEFQGRLLVGIGKILRVSVTLRGADSFWIDCMCTQPQEARMGGCCN